jgi:hypothetical protein
MLLNVMPKWRIGAWRYSRILCLALRGFEWSEFIFFYQLCRRLDGNDDQFERGDEE